VTNQNRLRVQGIIKPGSDGSSESLESVDSACQVALRLARPELLKRGCEAARKTADARCT
jgi:hypothetical protein